MSPFGPRKATLEAPPIPADAPALEAPAEKIAEYLLSLDESLREAETFRYACSSVVYPDARSFIEKELWIVDKPGHVLQLVLKEAQKKLYDLVAEKSKGPTGARIVVLKARQKGISTLSQALLFERAVRGSHVSTLTVAHRNKASDKIFAITRRFLRKLRFRLATRYAARREIEFSEPIGSTLSFDSAQNEDVGRAGTLQMLHLSEVAYWPNAEETFTSVLQCCPGGPGSVILVESTANGMGGYFYDLWQKARSGKDEWSALFIPWYVDEEYSLGFGSVEERNTFARSLDPEESELREKYGVTYGHLKWRRWCIAANCHGRTALFHQEYPSNDAEAFIASGTPYFDQRRVIALIQNFETSPLRRVDVDFVGKDEMVDVRHARVEDLDVQVRDGGNALVDLWEVPQPEEEYVIGGDAAEGLVKGDLSALHVLKASTRQQVAEVAGEIEPWPFADLLVALGVWFNNAYLIVEWNKEGGGIVSRARDRGYWNFHIERYEDRVSKEPRERFGYVTNSTTRPILLALMADNLHDDDPGIRSPALFQEILRFQKRGERAEHGPGERDDRLFARMLALKGASVIAGRLPKIRKEAVLLTHLPPEDRRLWRNVIAQEDAEEREAKLAAARKARKWGGWK